MSTQRLATVTDLDALGIPDSAFPDEITTAIKNAALDAASSVVASYMKKRFTFPLIAWGQDVRLATVSIAVYRLMSRRGFNPQSGLDSIVITNYRDQIGEPGKLGWLDRVARGDVEPDDLQDSTGDVDEASPLMDAEEVQGWQESTSAESSTADLDL